MSDEKFITICIILGVLSAIFLFSGFYHINKKLKIENFQATIDGLSDEQKCLHICSFEWHGFLEHYKFCVEKCDRISERENVNCKT